jgi:hypothetical protein
MDVEGSEYFALKGMTKLLSSAKHLVVEFIPDHLRNVSSVSPDELIALIEPHFNYLHIPSLNIKVPKQDFSKQLNAMYDDNISDNGIIFSK